MRLNARHILRMVLVAVAVVASGFNGYASVLTAFDVHTHGSHGLHSHDHHGHESGDHHAGNDQEPNGGIVGYDIRDDGSPAGDDQPCKHIHAHCCAAFAMVAADYGLSLAGYPRMSLPIADSLIPHGQIALLLFRPPRLGA
jgi:hypothetical protein